MKRLICGLVALCCLVVSAAAQEVPFNVENYQILTPDNISQIRMVAQLGPGSNAEPVWLDDNTLAINTTHGQWRYDVAHLDQPTFVPYLPSDAPPEELQKNWDLSSLDLKSIAISPDGTYEVELVQPHFSEPIMASDQQVTLIVRETDTGREVAQLVSDAIVPRSYGGYLALPHFGPLGLTYFRFDTLYRWSPDTQDETPLIYSDQIDREHVAFNPSGTFLAAFNLSLMEHAPITLRLWDLNVAPASLVLEKSFPDADAGLYQGSLNADFSSDGTTLITSRESQNIRVWDIASRGMSYRDTNPEYYSHAETHQVVYNPDDRFIGGCQLSQGDLAYAFIRDAATGQYAATINEFLSDEGSLCKVFFHPKHPDVLVTTRYGTLAVWPLADLLAQKSVTFEDAPLIFGDKDEADQARPIAVALNSDGSMIALAYNDNIIHLMDYETRQEISVLDNNSRLLSLLFNPQNDNELITGDESGSVRVWNLTTAAYKTIGNFKGPYSEYSEEIWDPLYFEESRFPLVINDAGTLLAALDGEGHSYFWDTITWDEHLGRDLVPAMFSPDGRFVVMFKGRDVSLWGVPKGN